MPPTNILLITTDQQSATMLSCAGNPDLNTPNMDALAAAGVRFEKAYAAQPLCLPQRCSWYTGLMPHQHGVTFNMNGDTMNVETTMGCLFRDAGYATGYSGKWHIRIPQDDTARHGFDWTSNIRSNGADIGIAPDFTRFLNGLSDQPFLFSASFNNPHNICEAARGGPFPDGAPGMVENMDQLPPLPKNFGIPDDEPSVLREIQNRYRDRNYPTANWDSYRWRLHRWYYCRLTELVDKHVGDVLAALQASGRAEDTLVVFTSDHGDGNAHHQWNQKQSLYDESARVPFIVSRPAGGPGRVESGQLVNTGIDLIPTLCGLADVGCPAHLAGQDWSESLSSEDIPPRRDHVIIETEFGTFGKPAGIMGRAVRTPHFKYSAFSEGKHHEFLVDMDQDPGETTNLAGSTEHQDELDRHRELLRNYITQTNDIFPLERVGPQPG